MRAIVNDAMLSAYLETWEAWEAMKASLLGKRMCAFKCKLVAIESCELKKRCVLKKAFLNPCLKIQYARSMYLH